ncbi:uncharacterized protein LY79DRAFT_578046 [Colletotrichum navitas]|uniref:Uncharacterized protein n=1 Tax=Colletotrichum navitas TaxID=681940 RepID=A0AAD8V809_9PEZI|nr:uncharacterized protein LY79DRAFT_578046 [Colletotrichum navitas]KAK1595236.1 hypothetical protein LY79DRAFT_578046 [Colletotrichum navitas]
MPLQIVAVLLGLTGDVFMLPSRGATERECSRGSWSAGRLRQGRVVCEVDYLDSKRDDTEEILMGGDQSLPCLDPRGSGAGIVDEMKMVPGTGLSLVVGLVSLSSRCTSSRSSYPCVVSVTQKEEEEKEKEK